MYRVCLASNSLCPREWLLLILLPLSSSFQAYRHLLSFLVLSSVVGVGFKVFLGLWSPPFCFCSFLLFPCFPRFLSIKSLALKAAGALSGQSVASSVSSSLWCFEHRLCLKYLQILHLVIISTFLGGMQYFLHAQDLGFMNPGFKCRLMTELLYNTGHVIFTSGKQQY